MIEKIVHLISERGYSKDEFERRAGLSHGRIGKWEKGTGEPTASQALAMARLLSVPLDYLVDDAIAEPDPGLSPDEASFLRFYRLIRAGHFADLADLLRLVAQPARPARAVVQPPTYTPGDVERSPDVVPPATGRNREVG